jgi:hypothetical protein
VHTGDRPAARSLTERPPLTDREDAMQSSALAIAPAVLLMVTLAAPLSAQVADHLKCYQMKDTLNLGGTADLDTPQFGVDPGCKIFRAQLFCVPAIKTNVSVVNKKTRQSITPLPFSGAPQPGDQICYKVKCPTPLAPMPDQAVTDQFGNRTLTKFKASFLCTPAVKGAAYCGDGTIDAGEECEPTNVGGATCAALGFASGTLACAPGCTFDLGGCVPNPPETCGNGTIESPESCDGANLGAATCTSLGYASGALACTAGCGFNTAGCTPYPASMCGNGTIESPESCDGSNLGGATCAGLGYIGGTLNCTDGCGYGVSLCVPAAFPASGQATAYTADKNDGIPGPVAVPDDGILRPGSQLTYLDNGDGTITDLNTGLMWEKKSDDGGIHDKDNRYVWSGNGSEETIWDWLDDLNAAAFAGQRDWRIPDVRELESLLDFERLSPAVAPEFDTNCMPGCTVLTCSCTLSDGQDAYFSSTTTRINTSLAWGVDFGSDSEQQLPRFFKGATHLVRAVRSGP